MTDEKGEPECDQHLDRHPGARVQHPAGTPRRRSRRRLGPEQPEPVGDSRHGDDPDVRDDGDHGCPPRVVLGRCGDRGGGQHGHERQGHEGAEPARRGAESAQQDRCAQPDGQQGAAQHVVVEQDLRDVPCRDRDDDERRQAQPASSPRAGSLQSSQGHREDDGENHERGAEVRELPQGQGRAEGREHGRHRDDRAHEVGRGAPSARGDGSRVAHGRDATRVRSCDNVTYVRTQGPASRRPHRLDEGPRRAAHVDPADGAHRHHQRRGRRQGGPRAQRRGRHHGPGFRGQEAPRGRRGVRRGQPSRARREGAGGGGDPRRVPPRSALR